MSAGSGIQHSEKNANHNQEVKFLQIWVMPAKRNIEPRYEQKSFPAQGRKNRLQTVVAPDNAEAVWINQNAWFTLGSFEKGIETTYHLNKKESGVYAFVIKGDVSINGVALNERDGLGITEIETLNITADNDAEVLLMEVPMKP
jgi:hypothetical protein